MTTYCRPLSTDIDIELFVDDILKINKREKRKAITAIADAERNIKGYPECPTLSHLDYRDYEYRSNERRFELRERIVKELIDYPRLKKDSNIKLGKGGAKPLGDLKQEKKVFYVIGPPASGKSGIANHLADLFGAYILDSDYAKRKLPEYTNQVGGATLVHEESDALVFSYDDKNLLDYCIENSYNMVIPKIGNNIASILKFCNTLKSLGFKIFLISIDLDRQKATYRAYKRFIEEKRYVPLSLIFDGYANDPILSYFKIKQQHYDDFDGFAQFSTDVKLDERPILLEEHNLAELNDLY